MMIRNMMMIVVALSVLCACSQSPAPSAKEAKDKASEIVLKNDDEKAFYSLGVFMHRDAYQLELTPEEGKYVQMGLADAVAGNKLATEPDASMPQLRKIIDERREKRKAAALEYLKKAASEKGAKKTASGVVFQEISAGAGAKPTEGKQIKVHYTATFINGKEFDSTYKREKPSEYIVGQILQCFSEGVELMKVGGKAKFYCPPETAYGDMGNPPVIPGGSLLIYEVELLDVSEAPPEVKE